MNSMKSQKKKNWNDIFPKSTKIKRDIIKAEETKENIKIEKVSYERLLSPQVKFITKVDQMKHSFSSFKESSESQSNCGFENQLSSLKFKIENNKPTWINSKNQQCSHISPNRKNRFRIKSGTFQITND